MVSLSILLLVVDVLGESLEDWWQDIIFAFPIALLWYLVQHGRQLNERPVVGAEGIGVDRHLGKSFFYAPADIRRIVVRRMLYGFGRPHDLLQIHGQDGHNRVFALSDLREADAFRQKVEQLAAAHRFPLIYQNAAGEVVDSLDKAGAE